MGNMKEKHVAAFSVFILRLFFHHLNKRLRDQLLLDQTLVWSSRHVCCRSSIKWSWTCLCPSVPENHFFRTHGPRHVFLICKFVLLFFKCSLTEGGHGPQLSSVLFRNTHTTITAIIRTLTSGRLLVSCFSLSHMFRLKAAEPRVWLSLSSGDRKSQSDTVKDN